MRIVRQRWRGLCAGAWLVCLLSCQTMPEASPGSQVEGVYLSDSRMAALLSPAVLGRSAEYYQQIEGSYGGQTYYLDAYVQVDRERLVMLAFNSFGSRVFEIEYTGDAVRFSAAIPAERMKPEYIVADFQLCYFPAGPLKRSLGRAGLSLEEREEGEELVRTVSDGDRVIIEIRRIAGILRYRNLLRGYQYVIRENRE